jgi:RNA polymerase sigma-70 factor (ECF subfamily)
MSLTEISFRMDATERRGESQPAADPCMPTRTPLAAIRNLTTDNADWRLMVAIQGRDRPAFEKLYLAYYQRLARFLAHFAMSRENIDEIISDTFIVIWTQTSGCVYETRISTWIIGIAYRTAMRHLTLQRKVSSLRSVSDLPRSTNGAEDWLCGPLARLPIQQRVTLSLAYQMGCSIEEIARVTESPSDTVESHMFHAHAKLREHALKRSLLGPLIRTEVRAPRMAAEGNHIELIVKAIRKAIASSYSCTIRATFAEDGDVAANARTSDTSIASDLKPEGSNYRSGP